MIQHPGSRPRATSTQFRFLDCGRSDRGGDVVQLGQRRRQQTIIGILGEAAFFTHPDYYFFGVSVDHQDRTGCAADPRRGQEWTFFWDLDGKVSRLFRALPETVPEGASSETLTAAYRPVTYVLDYNLRVVATVASRCRSARRRHCGRCLKRLPETAGADGRLLKPQYWWCPTSSNAGSIQPDRRLMASTWRQRGPVSCASAKGKTVLVLDHNSKRRSVRHRGSRGSGARVAAGTG